MLQQLDPQTVVKNFGEIAAAGKQVISTSIPSSELATFAALALQARSMPVSSVSFVPPKVNTSDPDWQVVRSMVADALDRSEAKDGLDLARALPRESASKRHRDANHSSDLARSC